MFASLGESGNEHCATPLLGVHAARFDASMKNAIGWHMYARGMNPTRTIFSLGNKSRCWRLLRPSPFERATTVHCRTCRYTYFHTHWRHSNLQPRHSFYYLSEPRTVVRGSVWATIASQNRVYPDINDSFTKMPLCRILIAYSAWLVPFGMESSILSSMSQEWFREFSLETISTLHLLWLSSAELFMYLVIFWSSSCVARHTNGG